MRKLDDRRIEVKLMRRDDAERQRVERQLTRPGTLEFRVLANQHVDKKLIDQAQSDPSKAEVLDAAGKRLAWWVSVKAGEEKRFSSYTDISLRTKKQEHRDITEILVIADPCNVTGAYAQTKLQFDAFGNPHVSFAFNNAGGELFGKLTGDHVSNDSAGFSGYKLGIIIDGELFSAPTIRSKITGKGEITGTFTEVEASDLAAVLNAGSLPVRLKLVEGN